MIERSLFFSFFFFFLFLQERRNFEFLERSWFLSIPVPFSLCAFRLSFPLPPYLWYKAASILSPPVVYYGCKSKAPMLWTQSYQRFTFRVWKRSQCGLRAFPTVVNSAFSISFNFSVVVRWTADAEMCSLLTVFALFMFAVDYVVSRTVIKLWTCDLVTRVLSWCKRILNVWLVLRWP